MEIENEVHFFPNRKKINLLGYIFILISLQLIVCKDIHAIVAAQDTSTIYSLSGTYSCKNCCETSALLYWEKSVHISGKSPRRNAERRKKCIFCIFYSALKLKRIVKHIQKVTLERILS